MQWSELTACTYVVWSLSVKWEKWGESPLLKPPWRREQAKISPSLLPVLDPARKGSWKERLENVIHWKVMYHESILLYTIASGNPFPPLLAARVVSSEIHSSGSSLGKPAMKQGRLVRKIYCYSIWIYRIAGNFRGAKHSWFSWLNTGPRIFYPRMKRPYPLPAVQAATTNWQYFDPRKLPAIWYIIWVTNGGSHTHHIRPHTGLIALRLIWWVLTRRVVQQ